VRVVGRFLALALLVAAGCGGGSGDGGDVGGSPLDDFATARIEVGGVAFEAWLAETGGQHRRGLMDATEDDLAPLEDGTPRGMLFLFDEDQLLSFFMRDTEVPLDLAYARADGRIVETHPLVPLDETLVVAREPVRYALEARRGTFAAHGIGVGDTLEVPAR
jgi:uncharacterized membrane protein (UPF0127 family)